ncbi:MAG: RagB/SusD family nutrient uptake outer membrane protein [Duncaniella sp.]|uniref:RagB/SusD family nutrient uptake outer membrane protein n=1 Tax=Duncaniella sp. TaxID=2518496 RepID=UPI0023CC3B88|nr:RagB/SusD family nutrient uptake outer membrane protein [Duncaniella sp.]MDE5988861.1 RagB/SusD family nutrient uptake outer membrane protein [Duncaniella sp.]
MKFHNIALKGLALSALIVASSCSDDFLDTKPDGLIDAEDVNATMQKDPSLVQSYLTGAYMNFYNGGEWRTKHDVYGIQGLRIALDMMTDDVTLPTNAQWFSFDYQLDNRMSGYRRTTATWRELYQVINDANTVIEFLKPADDSEPEGDARKMLGQAYALRALNYYYLINMWQQPYSVDPDAPGVPVKTESEYRPERVPVKEVYDQIISDITTAYNYLEGQNITDKGSISEYAAAFIYANVLMFTGDYAGAAEWAEKAIKGGQLNSNADMLSGFNSLDMPEVLWGYKVDTENTCYYASFFSHVDTYMPGYGGQVGFRKLIASELYDQIADNDIRKKWFGYEENYNLLEIDFSYEKGYNWLPYLSNKFRDKYMTSLGAEGPFTSDVIYMRVAEMYYVAAEAYYLNNQPDKAKEVLTTIMSNRVPGYTCTSTGEALYKEICVNKRIDMFEEGSRLFDIKRRNESIDRSLSVNAPISELSYINAVKYNGQDNKMIYQIPDVEIQNNPEITVQNP